MNTRVDVALVALVAIFGAAFIISYHSRPPAPENNNRALEAKYDSLEGLLERERRITESIIGEIGKRQDTINKLRKEVKDLQDERIKASSSHINYSDSAIISDVRKWADRHVFER